MRIWFHAQGLIEEAEYSSPIASAMGWGSAVTGEDVKTKKHILARKEQWSTKKPRPQKFHNYKKYSRNVSNY